MVEKVSRRRRRRRRRPRTIRQIRSSNPPEYRLSFMSYWPEKIKMVLNSSIAAPSSDSAKRRLAFSFSVVAGCTLLALCFNLDGATAFAFPTRYTSPRILTSTSSTQIAMTQTSEDETKTSSSLTAAKTKQTHSTDVPTVEKDPDDETTEKVFGAEFFGGNKQKEELFDQVAEDRAAELARQEREAMQLKASYKRFEDRTCFVDEDAAEIGRRLQAAVNGALYDEDEEDVAIYSTSGDFTWTTPFPRAKDSKTPLDELGNALSFYKHTDVAIVGGRTLPSSSSSQKEMEFRWETSVAWPNFWESRVLLTGTSRVVLDPSTSTIVSQSDKLDGGGPDGQNIVAAIGDQLNPRFWDLYHIGMTPSAELAPRLEPRGDNKKGLFSGSYNLFEVPPRLVVQPTMLDLGGREERIAQLIPNHAFSTIIKTTGPTKQRYTPVSPVEVGISRDAEAEATRVTWSIPIAPEFLAAAGCSGEMPLPAPDTETSADRKAVSTYKLQPRRLVATVPYGGNPQDEDVAKIRKELYDAVMKDGLKPQLDDSGRPKFFFWQNDAKACYVSDGGLGMAVYEWRPKFAKGNELGIELER